MNTPPPLSPTNNPGTQGSGHALASVILGICGIVLCLGPLAGIPAVICGHMAQSRIKRSGGALTGAGMATAGLVMGYFSFAMIFVIGMLAAIAIPNFVKARNQAQYNGCQNHLRVIQGGKEVWALETKQTQDAAPTEGDLFGDGKFIAALPICPAGGLYTLNAVKDGPECSVHGTIRGR